MLWLGTYLAVPMLRRIPSIMPMSSILTRLPNPSRTSVSTPDTQQELRLRGDLPLGPGHRTLARHLDEPGSVGIEAHRHVQLAAGCTVCWERRVTPVAAPGAEPRPFVVCVVPDLDAGDAICARCGDEHRSCNVAGHGRGRWWSASIQESDVYPIIRSMVGACDQFGSVT